MKYFVIVILWIVPCFPFSANGQDLQVLETDTIHSVDAISNADTLLNQSEFLLKVDSVALANELKNGLTTERFFKPDPNKAILYAIVPGLGQVYNRKYWKLPLVYGSVIGCVYAISWNDTQYKGYKKAYRDFQDNNPETNSWQAYRPMNYPEDESEWTQSERDWFGSSFLKRGRDNFRRWRDLSYFISAGVYALWIVDAYVDAQLFDFDISDDLSLRMDPVILDRTATINSKKTIGLQLSLSF